jgi:hypothetical protein
MTAGSVTAGLRETNVAVANLIRFLETGTVAAGLLAPDVFTDLSLPHWRVQTGTAAEICWPRWPAPPACTAGRAAWDRARNGPGSR